MLDIGTGAIRVPAVLDLPVGPGPFPGVVLVPGSGPENLNEQVLGGPEEPFRDIADALASHGFAVLRYDKPTFSNPTAFLGRSKLVSPKYTELADAAAAVAALAHQPGVAPNAVFLLGHSEGAYWAPELAAQHAAIKGLILLGAPTKPLAAYLVPQTRYLDLLKGPLTASERTALKTLAQEVARATNPRLALSTPASELPFGLPASYWRFFDGYSPTQTAARLSIPILVLQGGRDYQVPPSTLAVWRSALSHNRRAAFKLFPTLDHVFVAVPGPKSTPGDYLLPGHVSGAVIATLIDWLRTEAGR